MRKKNIKKYNNKKQAYKNKYNKHNFENTYKSKKKKKCNICFITKKQRNNVVDFAKPKTCEHIYCFPCIDKWSKLCNRCPVCKKAFRVIVRSDDNTAILKRKIKRKAFKGPDYLEMGSLLHHQYGHHVFELNEYEKALLEEKEIQKQKTMLKYYEYLKLNNQHFL